MAFLSGIAFLLAVACSTGVPITGGDTELPAVAQVLVPDVPAVLVVGDSVQLQALVLDANGTTLSGRRIDWASSSPGVLAVRSSGTIVGMSAGTSILSAQSEGIRASADVTVTPATTEPPPVVPVAQVTILPATPSLVVGDSILLQATPRDANGNALTGRTVTWSTTTPALVAVRSSGRVVGLAAGSAIVHATSEGIIGSKTVTVTAAPTNPPPPAQGEPVFAPASNTTLFWEDFEVYRDQADLITWQSHYPSRYATRNPGQIELRTTGAFAGQKSTRFHWPASETYQDADVLLEVTNVSGSAVPVVVYQFMVKWKPGFPHKRRAADRNGAGYKLFIHNIKGAGWERVLIGTSSVLPQFFPEYAAQWPDRIAVLFGMGDLYYQTNMNGKITDGDGYLNDGNWHRFTVRLTGSTFRTGTTGNGRIEAWVDGIKIVEYLGDVAGRPEYGKVSTPRTVDGLFDSMQFPSVFNGSPGPEQGDQWVEFDNLRVWRP